MLLNASGGDQTPAAYDPREQYTKFECRVPMRDGVQLFTAVLVPKDASTTYPFMLDRTPFNMGPYGPDEYITASRQTQAFLKAGYIWVRQDVRGRGLSDGEFTHVTPHRTQKRTAADVDESTDTYDTVEWLLQHVPNHNGFHNGVISVGAGAEVGRDAHGATVAARAHHVPKISRRRPQRGQAPDRVAPSGPSCRSTGGR